MDQKQMEQFVQNVRSIYDRLCAALTYYEAEVNDPDYDKGYALYQDTVDIVNDMSAMLN